MEIRSFVTTTIKFWQEIVFVIPVGIFLIDLFIGHPEMFDEVFDIAIICFHLVLFICLVGQFFWKNRKVAIVLTPFLLLYSFFGVFVSYAMPKDNPYSHLRILILILALFFVVATISMLEKYLTKSISGRESDDILV